ncbi:MAG: transposase [Rhodoferax sp.]|nr:transposase [Rhodoferax sp.]
MLKDSETLLFPGRRSHRTYTKQFKAELVAACQQPGCSIAALAGSHGMNVNVLHRWLKEHERSGRHRLGTDDPSDAVNLQLPTPAFIPIKLNHAAPVAAEQTIKVEIRKGTLLMSVSWPTSAVADFANWAAALVK